MTTATKTITFESIMVNFKQFVSKSQTRPVLTLVYFDGKYIVATDSHRLIRVNASYIENMPSNEPFLYDPKNNEFVDIKKHNYPDVSRLISTECNSIITLDKNLKDLEVITKEAKNILKGIRNSPVTFNFTDTHTNIHATDQIDENYQNTIESVKISEGGNIKISVSAAYLLQSIGAMKKLRKLSNDNIELKMISPMRPLVFSQSDIFQILILPIRLY